MPIIRKESRIKKNKPLANTSVLIVEDQYSIASMTEAMLQDRWGCNVTIANSYEQAREILESAKTNFFITISDLNLPGAKNGEIIDLLMEHQQSVIAITGYFNKDMHWQLTEKGVIDYVLKNNINAYEFLVNLVGRLYFNQFIHVLIIDDSPSIQQVTGAYLKKQFLNVNYASNGEEGLSILNQHPEIKLVLVDAEMPLMDGLTFTAKARQIKNQNKLCIIGISGSEQKDLSAQFLKQGANDYISKPFSYDEITCRINQNLNMLAYFEEINKIANIDFLTELPNRRHFFTTGELAVKSAINNKQHLAVLILDIDFFKLINDNYGHDFGDEALKHVAKIIENTLSNHIVARLGGEEFGFIIQESNFSISSALIEQLRLNIQNSQLMYENTVVPITASIGATYEPKKNLEDMLQVADEHLYLAKQSGRNKIVWNHNKPNLQKNKP